MPWCKQYFSVQNVFDIRLILWCYFNQPVNVLLINRRKKMLAFSNQPYKFARFSTLFRLCSYPVSIIILDSQTKAHMYAPLPNELPVRINVLSLHNNPRFHLRHFFQKKKSPNRDGNGSGCLSPVPAALCSPR